MIGFNSGRYDLNLIKKHIAPYLLTTHVDDNNDDNDNDDDENDKTDGDRHVKNSMFVVMRNTNFMCLKKNTLTFLDIMNYLAPGFSYEKFLKAYGCTLSKGFLPYEWVTSLSKLDYESLPPKEAFHSELKNEDISDQNYAYCEQIWRDHDMKTFRDFLIWYNNTDVVPFLEAIEKQFHFYKLRHIDMFKDGISVPGLTMTFLFDTLPRDIYFTLFNQKDSHLHDLVRNGITGGSTLIFHRYHEVNVTTIRQSKPCHSIVGYDANALYLWSISQLMPTGCYIYRTAESNFKPKQSRKYGKTSLEWLEWLSYSKNIFHDCPCQEEHTNTVNGKSMSYLLSATKKNTEYLNHYGTVVEMWECKWKKMRTSPDVKHFLDSKFPNRNTKWEMTQQNVLENIVKGNLFGIVECDISVPEHLRSYFAEMQPIFKNANISRDDIGEFMYSYAVQHEI